ncbi:MAG TPA: hypothetical protein VFQ53_11055 [Kofleriaceae bacterium]|nr:hypothetical protein [Kofleriaceae bacterium]
MQPSACNLCGKHLQPSEVNYLADARVACAQCFAKVDLVQTDMRVGNNIRNAGYGALISAAVSFIFNPVFLLTVSSMISAIYAIGSVNRKGDERFTQHIARDKGTIYACAIIAIVLNAIVIVLNLIVFSAMTARPRPY